MQSINFRNQEIVLIMRIFCDLFRIISRISDKITIGYGILICFTVCTAAAQPQFSGFLENRFFITISDNDVALSHLEETLRFGDFNRARTVMTHQVSDNSSLTVALDYFTYHGFLQQQFRQPVTGTDPTASSEDQRIVVDRAYLRLYFSDVDLTIGKQRISWGRSLLWSPFDVFNRVNFFEPQEEKFGVIAFRVTIPLGNTGSLEGAYVPENRFDTSSGGMRLLWNWKGIEFTASALHFANPLIKQNIFGLDWKGDAKVGLWFEGAIFNEKPFAPAVITPREYFRWLLGTDYSFAIKNGLLIMAEYSHDESGVAEKRTYNYDLLFAGIRPLLGRDYLYGSTVLQYSDLLSGTVAVLANLNDSGILIMPSVQYLIFPDTELRIGAFISAADTGTEFNPSEEVDPVGAFGNSTVYTWLRLYF